MFRGSWNRNWKLVKPAVDGRGERGRGSEKTMERRESEEKEETKNWDWGREMGWGDTDFWGLSLLRILGLLPRFPGPSVILWSLELVMLGEAQCFKLPPQERSPNFYLVGSHLGPTLLVWNEVGWAVERSQEWEGQKKGSAHWGSSGFSLGTSVFFSRPWHLSSHCSVWAGPCAQWQSEYHPSPLTGIRTGAPLSDIERDLTVQFLWLQFPKVLLFPG